MAGEDHFFDVIEQIAEVLEGPGFLRPEKCGLALATFFAPCGGPLVGRAVESEDTRAQPIVVFD